MGNTNNVVFLKSTEGETLEMLQKMSGTTHKSYVDSKTVTRDNQRLFMQNEGKTSYTMSTKEEPVISMNDMLFIPPRNSMVFMAGDSPVWNRNEMVLPMSWKLHADTIKQPGKVYTFQTLPTLSNAKDFDVKQNQPDFFKMVAKRMKQALTVNDAKEIYKKIMGYDEADLTKLDIDAYSDDIMNIVNAKLHEADNEDKELNSVDKVDLDIPESEDPNDWEIYDEYGVDNDFADNLEDNEDVINATAKAAAMESENEELRYAGGRLSINSLGSKGCINRQHDAMFSAIYNKIKIVMQSDTKYFSAQGDNLLSADSSKVYIKVSDVSEAINTITEASKNPNSSVYADGEVSDNIHGSYTITKDFYDFLTSLDDWNDIAGGKFEKTAAEYFDSENL